MKVAILTDWMYGGGGELVVEQVHKLFPDAPIYTSYCSEQWRKRLNNKVVTGYLQNAPFKQLRKFLPLLRQWWFKRLDLSGYDVIISVTGNGEAKFARAPNGKHICYCHTPTHFYWRHYDEYLKNPGFRPQWLARLGLKLLIKPLRKRDYAAAQKVDQFIANSTHIQTDIKQFYNRDSVVIHPPVDTDRFAKNSSAQRSGFVTVGRLVPLKRNDILIEACNRLNLPLTIVGDGPEMSRLKALAGPTVTLTGRLEGSEVVAKVQQAEAFLFASFEDFGISPVEAMAAGTPVIAYKAGGTLDYVIEGKTGLFFTEQTPKSLATVLKTFNPKSFSSQEIQTHAQKFSAQEFHKKFKELIREIG